MRRAKALGVDRLRFFWTMHKPVYAILVGGGVLTKKLSERLNPRPPPPPPGAPPPLPLPRVDPTADDIVAECARLQARPEVQDYELLRIYYYDAAPSNETVRLPVSNGPLSLATTDRYRKSQQLHDSLILKPHFALRMGEVRLNPNVWRVKPQVAKKLARASRVLTDNDFILDLNQKGVDMRIGMDMARLCLRDMVRALIVVTGDSDFVPAFKFVRREGVKVFLEPMGHNVRVELKQHADLVF
jgi:uncharacterized LabA/DUF88 family protein